MIHRAGLVGRDDLMALGYREVVLGGISWLVQEAGSSFLAEGDWSNAALALKKWRFWDKGSHALYLTNQDSEGNRFLIKVYHAMNRGGFLARATNKAKTEFANTVFAYTKGFNTVVPVAMGTRKQNPEWGVVIYPFLEHAISLEEAYPHHGHDGLPLADRRHVEKIVSQFLRQCLDSGIFPANMCLGHFLARRGAEGKLEVFWVDFEKVKVRSLFREKYAVRNLAKLLARIEWLRASGSKMNRASVMRIAYRSLKTNGARKMDKRLCRVIIQAARKYWQLKGLDEKGSYPLSSIQPSDHGAV